MPVWVGGDAGDVRSAGAVFEEGQCEEAPPGHGIEVEEVGRDGSPSDAKLLDHILILGEAHPRRVLTTCEDHYNRDRPHQARDQLPPDVHQHPAAVHDLGPRRLLRTRIRGGLVNEYRYAA